jgi:hypothetical protein
MFVIEPYLVKNGVIAQEVRRGSSDGPSAPFTYADGSYCNLMTTIISDSNRKFKISEAVGAVEGAITSLTANTTDNPDALNVSKLVEAGYVKTIQASYTLNKENLDNFKASLSTTVNVLRNLNSKGFDVYRKETMSRIVDAISNGKIADFDVVTNYYNKNALILNFGLRLANE